MASSSRKLHGDGHKAAWPHYMRRYENLGKLGKVINGEVFKAWDTQANRLVAVKRLNRTGGDGVIAPGLLEVLRECWCLKTCDGIPSTVKIRDKMVPAFQSEGDCFIVMEYAGCVNLRRYMQDRARRPQPFSEAEVQGIMKRLLGVVKSMHGKGIMHLDIRPETVILGDGREDVTERPTVRASFQKRELKEGSIVYTIGGLGMARMKERGPTQEEVITMTPYSAPELFPRAREYSEVVDTWSLGCIMSELLSGADMATFGVQHHFPSSKLSCEGAEVLRGLLESNPAKRLSAAQALNKPWFQKPPPPQLGARFRY